ncbi:hypothetical protein LP419_11795 [Massilia sp. H-1]|nr:hypothetical protein LP419_11795 [Massilia sp. H-1]
MSATYTGSQAADIHRKLASLRARFPQPLDASKHRGFLGGTCKCEDSALLRATLALFNDQFGTPVPPGAPDFDGQVWRKLNQEA